MNKVIKQSTFAILQSKFGATVAFMLVMALAPFSVALGNKASDGARQTTEDAARSVGDAASETANELGVTNEIRQQIMADNTLTSKAKGVSVSTDDGTVTLKGEVASTAEREKVISIARKVASGFNIDNQLEVKP
jgi:osmotically-inducible protein OsmY